jgi:hypothetical protein
VAKLRAIGPLRSARKRVKRIRLKGHSPNPVALGLTLVVILLMYGLMWLANAGD